MPKRAPSDFVSTGDLGRLAGSAGRPGHALSRLAVYGAWRDAVGEVLGAVTAPAAYARGALTVDVEDAAWAREAERLRPEILGRLSALLPAGSVTSIRFRQAFEGAAGAGRPDRGTVHVVAGRRGAARFPDPAPAPGGTSPLQDPPASAGESPVFEAHSSNIRDERLRRRFGEVASRYLGPPRRRAPSA